MSHLSSGGEVARGWLDKTLGFALSKAALFCTHYSDDGVFAGHTEIR